MLIMQVGKHNVSAIHLVFIVTCVDEYLITVVAFLHLTTATAFLLAVTSSSLISYNESSTVRLV